MPSGKRQWVKQKEKSTKAPRFSISEDEQIERLFYKKRYIGRKPVWRKQIELSYESVEFDMLTVFYWLNVSIVAYNHILEYFFIRVNNW